MKLEEGLYSLKKVADMLGGKPYQEKIQKLVKSKKISAPITTGSKSNKQKYWTTEGLIQIFEQLGFFPKFDSPVAAAVFTTKGGVLKSTLSLNLARIAALHGFKVCVVGLDMQCDITTSLGFERELEEELEEVDDKYRIDDLIQRLDSTVGLCDFINGDVRLEDIIVPTDLPNLFLIPETPELVACNESLSMINRREYWLKDKVVEPLKKVFDLIIMDCSPNWNKLTTNALVASDVLLSPIECKINNFRNFKVFRRFLEEFRSDMELEFPALFIPTKYAMNKKLTLEIKTWYQSHVSGCTDMGIRESSIGEEATALNMSILEHAPNQVIGKEMKKLFTELHGQISSQLVKSPKLNTEISIVQ